MRISIDIAAPLGAVWREAADLASHAEWMGDARDVRFLSERREGVGTVMEVETRLGPLRTSDVIEVTGWEPPRRIEVEHRGAVSGRGVFRLEQLDADRTRLSWTEDLSFPWYFGGPVGAKVATPMLRRAWLANLERFRRRVEA